MPFFDKKDIGLRAIKTPIYRSTKVIVIYKKNNFVKVIMTTLITP